MNNTNIDIKSKEIKINYIRKVKKKHMLKQKQMQINLGIIIIFMKERKIQVQQKLPNFIRE